MLSRVTASGARFFAAPVYVTRTMAFSFNIDTLGNTPLHHAIHEGKLKTKEDFKAFTDDHADVDVMLKCVNNSGFLPIQCINPWLNDARLTLSKTMLAAMTTDEASIEPLFEAPVLAAHGNDNIPGLNANLALGVALVNSAKQRIPLIPIHPKQSARRSIRSDPEVKISKMRNFINARIRQDLPGANIYDHPDVLFRIAALANKVGVGNCAELSMSVLYELASLKCPQTHGELMCLQNGDHTVVVLGRQLTSLRNQPFYWGDAAVIVDPTLPAVFPVAKLETHLRAFTSIQIPMVAKESSRCHATVKLTYYNSAFHRIDISTKEHIVADRLSKYGLFKYMQITAQHEEDYLRFNFPK